MEPPAFYTEGVETGMITDSIVTIYNRRLTADNEEILIPTVIRDATWFYGRRSSGGQFSDNEDTYSVRIPFDADTSGKTYVEPWEWKNLTDEQASGHWTIQNDDVVVRGEMTEMVSDQTEIMKVTENCFVVNSFANNTIRGSNRVKHWRIGGI